MKSPEIDIDTLHLQQNRIGFSGFIKLFLLLLFFLFFVRISMLDPRTPPIVSGLSSSKVLNSALREACCCPFYGTPPGMEGERLFSYKTLDSSPTTRLLCLIIRSQARLSGIVYGPPDNASCSSLLLAQPLGLEKLANDVGHNVGRMRFGCELSWSGDRGRRSKQTSSFCCLFGHDTAEDARFL